MMRPRAVITSGIAGLAVLGLLANACSKADTTASQSAPPESSAAATPTAATPPPAFDPNAPPPPPTASPTATATTVPSAPVVVVPPEEPNAAPSQAAKPRAIAPAARPAPPKAYKPSDGKFDDDGLHSTPAPSLGVKKIGVSANNHFTCTSTEKRDNVAAISEPRGARISIIGQGPCQGEVHDWSAQVSERRVEVQGTHGTASKCRCVGSGELVLRGLEPGTYDVAVNGGFDRPIATRITVSQ